MEVWKDIKGYEGLYQVSNIGRVKSIERKIKRGNHFLSVKEKILKHAPNLHGYLTVSLWKNNKGKTHSIHVLVAIAFLNHKPNKYKVVVDHKNNIRTDNSDTNLQLISNRKNCTKDLKGHSSDYVGVHWHKVYKKWQSMITINGKYKYLGRFEYEYDAHLAYQNALKNL